jgi:hypothetical protein
LVAALLTAINRGVNEKRLPAIINAAQEAADFSGATFTEVADFMGATFKDYLSFTGSDERNVFCDSSSLDLQFAKSRSLIASLFIRSNFALTGL